jgi:hypothetical protein
MRSHRPTWLAAAAAAALTALALALAPAGVAAKGAKSPPAAPPQTDLLLYGGATTVALDPGAAGALESLGVSVAPVRPASASKAGIRFPITLGVVDGTTLEGQIRHAGGLVFSKGDTRVILNRFYVNVDEQPDLSGLVGVGAFGTARASLFDLGLEDLKVDAGTGSVRLSGIALRLTAGAADALNAAFGAGASPFAPGLLIGGATVHARTVPVSVG